MHFSYIFRTITTVLLAALVSVGALWLSQGYVMMLQYETVPLHEVITGFLVLVFVAAVIWVAYMLWGLVLRMLLWHRMLDNRIYATSRGSSVLMMSGKSKRSMRVYDEHANVTSFHTISRGLDIVDSDGLRQNNLEVAKLRTDVEEMRNNALAYEKKSHD